MTSRAALRAAPRYLVAVLIAAAFLVRSATLGLPVDRADAIVATAAEDFAHDRLGAFAERSRGTSPLLAFLAAIPAASGPTPTAALRWTSLLLGTLVPLLLVGVAMRLGASSRAAWLAGFLAAAHPMLVAHGGGADAGSGALSTVLVLCAVGGLAREGAVHRRTAGLVAALLPWAAAVSVAFTPAFLWVALRREPSRTARIALPLLALATTLSGPALVAAPAGDAPVAHRAAGFVLQWLPLASLVVLAPFVPAGIARLDRGPARPAALAWSVGSALLVIGTFASGGFPFGWEGPRAALPAVPLVLLAGAVGWDAAPRVGWRRVVPHVAFLVALPLALFLAWGPLQRRLLPGAVADAGRLSRLSTAVEAAAAAAGLTGWVGYDLGAGGEQADLRLHDALRGRRAGPLRPVEGGAPPLRPEDLPPGETMGAVVAVDLFERGETPGRRAILVEEAIDRYGRWVVLRLRRPR